MTAKQLPLNQAFAQLEKLVAEFESGEIQLEESVAKFREGMELAQQLKKRLAVIENEITTIKDEFDRSQQGNTEDDQDGAEASDTSDELPF